MKNYLMGSNRRNNDIFGDMFDDFFKPFYLADSKREMKTDVKETENGYEVSIDMPGYDKKDINLSLKDGYLTVKAEKTEKEEDNKKYVLRERSVSCARSYYLGEEVSEEDIKAKYQDGTLYIDIKKKEEKPALPKNIQID